MSRHATTAKVIEELVDYDGPQLLLLKSNRSHYMLATAIQRQDMDEPFFGCELRDKTYDLYFEQKADLHFAFARAFGRNYYFFDLAEADKQTVKLTNAKTTEVDNLAYWPQIGFFARSHTTSYNRAPTTASTRSFKIDGVWAANDFSHFHAKMSDLYALFGVLERLEGTHSATERSFIRQTINDRFWQGGGSYVGFYDSLFSRNRDLKLAPLDVAKIQYASPGEITLRGNKKALSDVSDILSVFEEKWDDLAWTYRSIRGSLRKEGLLSAEPNAQFSTPAARDFIKKTTREFAENMNIDHIDEIYEACDSNTLVFAKVILSIFRRANELYIFQAEGRVQRIE